jgi:DNA-binding NtrC family response regulator
MVPSTSHPEFTILVVDDDAATRRALVDTLERAGYRVRGAASTAEARRITETEEPALAVVDLVLPDGDGISLISELRGAWPAMPAIVVTSYVEPRSIVEAMRRGAVDYLPKPFDPDEFLSSCRAALSRRTSPGPAAAAHSVPIVGESAATLSLRESLQRLACSRPRGVLITGEVGSGKTWAAQALHAASPRRDAPCLFLPCDGAYAPGVALFGASGAGGLLAATPGGTVILDDVERLEAQVQMQLLEWLDRARGEMPLLVGLSTRTERDSALMAWLGRACVEVPPLRDRVADIVPLARHFLVESRQASATAAAVFTRATEQQLVRHTWPGNVRELRDAIRRAAAASSPVIEPMHLELVPTPGAPAAWTPAGDPRPLREVTAAYIAHVMAVTGGNKTRAARLLGVARETLRHHVNSQNGRTQA